MFAAAEMSPSADSLSRFFGVIFALAIGEAFKQFVAEPDNTAKNVGATSSATRTGGEADKTAKNSGMANPGPKAKPHIQWKRLPALIAFLVLIVPFFHGMSRLFYDVYRSERLPSNYGVGLLIDFSVCTTLAAMFFILSRSLSPGYFRRFYETVSWLLLLDILWIIVHVAPTGMFNTVDQKEMCKWAYINVVVVIVLVVVLFADRPSILRPLFVSRQGTAASIPRHVLEFLRKPSSLTVLMLLRIACDYWFNSHFYFPTP